MHAARLNALARKFGAKRYLEVGVCEGATFRHVDVEYKVAVDPNFLFDYRPEASERTVFYPVTSDRFFMGTDETAFDLIFLDGLHTFEQTLKDFLASQRLAHARTIWLLDDTVPNDSFAALPDQQRCYRLRQARGNPDWAWMGDVYKVVFFIRVAMHFFDFRTYRGHGQTVVWSSGARYVERAALPLASLSGMTFEDLIDHLGMMNVDDDEAILAAVGT